MTYKNTLLLFILGIILLACGPTRDEQINANKELIKEFTLATNNADWDAFDSLLTDDFRRHSQATPGVVINSREAFVKLQKSFLESCPDQKITPDMLVAEGDKVAAYATYSGTQTGPLGDFPPKGKSMDCKFIAIFRIQNGRIAELWVEWDNLAMLTQLGHFPPGETSAVE
jgi:steroid delta-isomerase-like uncharacterized protein